MFKKILLATDGSKNSKAAAAKAIHLSTKFKCPLLVVSIIDVTDEFKAIASDLEEKMAVSAKSFVNNVIKQAEKAGVKAQGIVRSGEPYVQITKIAKKKEGRPYSDGNTRPNGNKKAAHGQRNIRGDRSYNLCSPCGQTIISYYI